MDELLKKLLEADILTEETKNSLEAAFQSQLSEAIERVEGETSERVRAELTEQWINERDVLIEAVDTKVSQFLSRELDELKEDISRFRDLEAEYAAKLVESKEQMAVVLQTDIEELVEKLNTFLEMRLAQELDELKEDLQEAKKLQFGRELFEGFVNEYRKSFINEDGIESELVEARKALAETKVKLDEAVSKIESSARETKMVKLLQPLQGKTRDIMESILTNVPTAQLEEGYKTFIGRVMKESSDDTKKEITKESTAKETKKVLAEDGSEGNKKEALQGIAVKGDTDVVLEAQHIDSDDNKQQLDESNRAALRKLAGLQPQ